MDKKAKKENRGGAREGAGRKGLGSTKRVSVCLTDELVPVFKQLGGAKWLRCELERVAEPARTLDTCLLYTSDRPDFGSGNESDTSEYSRL